VPEEKKNNLSSVWPLIRCYQRIFLGEDFFKKGLPSCNQLPIFIGTKLKKGGKVAKTA
jgi:hypothetical protein